MTKTLANILAALFFSTLVSAAEPDRVLAKVGDSPITLAEVEAVRGQLDQNALRYYDEQPDPLLLLVEIARRHRLADAAVAAGLDQSAEHRAAMSLTSQGLLVDAYIEKVILPRLISEADLEAAWEERKDSSFRRPLRYRARQILVTPKKDDKSFNSNGDDATTEEDARRKIEFINGKVKAGADFAELAANFSEDRSAQRGGDLGWFGPGDMVEAFESAISEVAVGETSDIIETEYGFHIVKLIDRRSAGYRPLDEVRRELLRALGQGVQDDVLREIEKETRRLEAESPLEIVDPATQWGLPRSP